MPILPNSLRYPELPQGYDPLDPWKTDLCRERKTIAVSLSNYFSSKASSTGVVAVNAGWGMGKSLFLRMWQDDQLNQGRACLYFNAWEYDFTESPVLSFLTALQRQTEDIGTKLEARRAKEGQPLSEENEKALGRWESVLANLKSGQKRVNELAGRAWRVGFKVAKAAAPAFLGGGVAMASMNMGMSPECASMVFEGVKSGSEAVTGTAEEELKARQKDAGIGEKWLAEASDSMKSMAQFRQILAQYASELSQDSCMPLIIMVDELDRCRPDFAIALLEEIKHLFAVPGVYFVLAVEKEQLGNCLKATYGLKDRDSLIYLDKFIDLTVELPVPPRDDFIALLDTHVTQTRTDTYRQFLFGFIEQHTPNISLRGLAQTMTRLGFIKAQDIDTAELIDVTMILLLMQDGRVQENAFQYVLQLASVMSKDFLEGRGKDIRRHDVDYWILTLGIRLTPDKMRWGSLRSYARNKNSGWQYLEQDVDPAWGIPNSKRYQRELLTMLSMARTISIPNM